MKISFFDTHEFEKTSFNRANAQHQFEINFIKARLTASTANAALENSVVCAFVNDTLNADVLSILKKKNIELIALRSAGFNHVDLKFCKQNGLRVVRVPEYSPHAVAEHAVALILTLNRKTHRAYNRTREGNFSLDGLIGFDLYKKTVGLVGTGKIGSVMAQIMLGFGCRVLAYDIQKTQSLVKKGVTYCSLKELIKNSDIISLHTPLNSQTQHIIDEEAFSLMKRGAMLINTGRGGLIDTKALIKALKSSHLGFAGLDVYEEEEGLFFEDLSGSVLQDDTLARLLTFPNVLLTSHQAFLTKEALSHIAETTLESISEYVTILRSKNLNFKLKYEVNL